MELNKPQARWTEEQIRHKIQRWLSGSQYLEELIRYQIEIPRRPLETTV
jgi:hypothetical protein